MTTETKRPYRASQTYLCSLPECGREFRAMPSDRIHGKAYCCQSHAAQDRERLLGHERVTMPCGTCGQPVTRPNSRMPGKTAYCNKACWSNRGRGLKIV